MLALVGCLHTAEHAENAAKASGYEIALEICVQQAMKEIEQKVPKEKVQANYDMCAAAADKVYGRK